MAPATRRSAAAAAAGGGSRTALVVGGAGFLGQHIVRQLLDTEEVRLLREITANDAAIQADGTPVQFAVDALFDDEDALG